MRKFDLKSALFGLGAGVLATFVLGATSSTTAPAHGRFQMACTEAHALAIDTATGQVWRGYFNPGSGNTDGDFLKPKLPATR